MLILKYVSCVCYPLIKMAKTFACKDIGLADCPFQASAETEDELMAKVAEHTKAAHNMQAMDTEMLAKIRAAIKEA